MCHFNSGSDWEDPDDPMVIAETELNSAAITIDAAAKKLANLKPRKSIHHVSKGIDLFLCRLSVVCSLLSASPEPVTGLKNQTNFASWLWDMFDILGCYK